MIANLENRNMARQPLIRFRHANQISAGSKAAESTTNHLQRPRGNTATACCDRKVAMVALEMPREFISHPVMKQVSGRELDVSWFLSFHDSI